MGKQPVQIENMRYCIKYTVEVRSTVMTNSLAVCYIDTLPKLK